MSDEQAGVCRAHRRRQGRARSHRRALPSCRNAIGRSYAAAVDEMAQEGMRVLAVARASVPAEFARPETPRDFPFEFLGLVGLADPLRPTVPAAVQECRAAGIRVIMITGDYPQTARAIAAQAGLEAGDVVTGAELEAHERRRAYASACARPTIFARTMPEQKLRIVKALKANGEVVAMTGDGVNDAPSLKAAHIGIAMGGRGTDVAREAASLVLLDDDFASIVTAVRLGRRIYDNLRKAMAYILAVHVPIAGLALIPLLFGLPLVFWPLHIAFLEMVIDPVCSIVFEAEGEEADTMRRPPRHPSAAALHRRLCRSGACCREPLSWRWSPACSSWRCARTCRNRMRARWPLRRWSRPISASCWSTVRLSASVFAAFTRPNAALWWVVAATAAILAGVILFPPARELFHFGPLHGDDIVVALASGLIALLLLELAKRAGAAILLCASSANRDRQAMNQSAVQREPTGKHHIDHNRFVGRTRVAYFSMEIAISPEMPTYSGGLGILAGDTARAAADLDLPIVFVTLISRAGYLRQELDAAGRQATLFLLELAKRVVHPLLAAALSANRDRRTDDPTAVRREPTPNRPHQAPRSKIMPQPTRRVTLAAILAATASARMRRMAMSPPGMPSLAKPVMPAIWSRPNSAHRDSLSSGRVFGISPTLAASRRPPSGCF